MGRTIRIFDDDPYLTEYQGRVVSCQEKNGRFETVLEATIFFPEQGGQSPDRGTLGGQQLIDVKHRDGIIYHITEGRPADGCCRLDWEHRFSNMQQHTGEHIFSGISRELYGYENVGFHLSDHVVTLDTSGPLTKEQINDIEGRANRVITKNHPIRAFYPAPEDADKYDYRSKDGIEGEVRLVEIQGVDLCACCAPHVRLTGEVGILKVVDFQSYKGGTRVSILCGKRALELFCRDEELLSGLRVGFSCKREEIGDCVEKLRQEKLELGAALREAQEENLRLLTEGVPVDITSPILFTKIKNSQIVRNTVNNLTDCHGGFCGIFSGGDGHYSFVIGSKNADCSKLLGLLQGAGAKGGGSQRMVQGTAEMKEEDIRRIWKEADIL